MRSSLISIMLYRFFHPVRNPIEAFIQVVVLRSFSCRLILWKVTKSRQQKSNESSTSRDVRSPFQVAPCCAPSLPYSAPHPPSLLPLERPCSLSRSKTEIPNPRLGVYIIYMYTPISHITIPCPGKRWHPFFLGAFSGRISGYTPGGR